MEGSAMIIIIILDYNYYIGPFLDGKVQDIWPFSPSHHCLLQVLIYHSFPPLPPGGGKQEFHF